MKKIFTRNVLIWLGCLIFAVIFTATGNIPSIGEGFAIAYLVSAIAKYLVRFIGVLANTKDDNTFGGSIKYGVQVIKALFTSMTAVLREVVALIIWFIILVSLDKNMSYPLLILVTAVAAVIPSPKKKRSKTT